MLHEFDVWMEKNYVSKKVRKDRWAWNFAILKQRPIAVRENRQWSPAISYCRYADDFVIVVKGTREHAETVREACRGFLEGELKLTLNYVVAPAKFNFARKRPTTSQSEA
jgi:RNA-directed DNA polymerase